jgi:hypothetical protein
VTRTTTFEPSDLRVAGGLMLAAGLLLPRLPGHPGIACPLRALTGVPCPLCGMTTSVEGTLELHLRSAFSANPAGLLAVLGAIALVALRPKSLVVPRLAIVIVLAAMWAFELHRFGFI